MIILIIICDNIVEREEKEDEEIRIMKRDSAEDQRRLNVVKARMNGIGGLF